MSLFILCSLGRVFTERLLPDSIHGIIDDVSNTIKKHLDGTILTEAERIELRDKLEKIETSRNFISSAETMMSLNLNDQVPMRKALRDLKCERYFSGETHSEPVDSPLSRFSALCNELKHFGECLHTINLKSQTPEWYTVSLQCTLDLQSKFPNLQDKPFFQEQRSAMFDVIDKLPPPDSTPRTKRPLLEKIMEKPLLTRIYYLFSFLMSIGGFLVLYVKSMQKVGHWMFCGFFLASFVVARIDDYSKGNFFPKLYASLNFSDNWEKIQPAVSITFWYVLLPGTGILLINTYQKLKK
jgi:hypothetical protein